MKSPEVDKFEKLVREPGADAIGNRYRAYRESYLRPR